MSYFTNLQFYETTEVRYTSAPNNIVIGATSNLSASVMTKGIYHAISDTACYMLQGADNTVVVASTNGHYLPAGQERIFLVTGTSDTYMAGIQKAAAGTLQLHKIADV